MDFYEIVGNELLIETEKLREEFKKEMANKMKNYSQKEKEAFLKGVNLCYNIAKENGCKCMNIEIVLTALQGGEIND